MIRGRRQAAERLEIGDEVILTSGVYGIVTGFFADGVVWIEIDEGVQVRVDRTAIRGKVGTVAAATQADPSVATERLPSRQTSAAVYAAGAQRF